MLFVQNLICFSALLTVIAELESNYAVIKSVEKVHNQLLINVFHHPMSFYDTHPIGRVLHLFASDLDIVEDELPESLEGTIWLLLEVIHSLVWLY